MGRIHKLDSTGNAFIDTQKMLFPQREGGLKLQSQLSPPQDETMCHGSNSEL